jgi:hypothetical protein
MAPRAIGKGSSTTEAMADGGGDAFLCARRKDGDLNRRVCAGKAVRACESIGMGTTWARGVATCVSGGPMA